MTSVRPLCRAVGRNRKGDKVAAERDADQVRGTFWAWPRLAFAAVLGVAVLSHLPALWGGFVYDDFADVVDNPSAKAATYFARLWGMTRPLLKASYAAQDALHGPGAPAYHLVNLALHLVTVALVLVLMRRAAGLAGYKPIRALWIGGLAAAIWAVHPAAVDTVGQVAGRSAGLSTTLVLLALWLTTGPRAHPVGAGLAAGLAVLTRETALVAPLLLLVWQLCLPTGQGARRVLPVWIGVLLAGALLMAMPRHRELVAFSLDQRAPIDALRANVFAVTEMLRLWLTPWQIGAVPSQPVAYGWLDAPTLIRLVGLGGALLAALVLRRRWPLLALAILWVGVALLPTNSVIWRVNPVAMRPLYLAGIGLALVLALGLSRLVAGRVLGSVLIAGLGVLTWQREMLYADPVAYFADAAQKAPGQAAPLVLLGLTLANGGQVVDARAVLEEALRIDPANPEAANALRLLQAGSVYSPSPP